MTLENPGDLGKDQPGVLYPTPTEGCSNFIVFL